MVFLRLCQEEWQHLSLTQPMQAPSHAAFPELALDLWVTRPPCGCHSKSLFPLWTTRHAPVWWWKVIMNVNDLSRHRFHQDLTPGFLFDTVITHCLVAAHWADHYKELCDPSARWTTGWGSDWGMAHLALLWGSGDTRNMDQHLALGMGRSRSRSKCLAGVFPFLQAKLGRFHSDVIWPQHHHHAQRWYPLPMTRSAQNPAMQAKIWTAGVTLAVWHPALPLLSQYYSHSFCHQSPFTMCQASCYPLPHIFSHLIPRRPCRYYSHFLDKQTETQRG